MPAVCFCFQIHQPYRLRRYTVFNLGENHHYENVDVNRSIVTQVARRCYLPMNHLLMELIEKYPGKFKCSFAITGTALDQFADYAPEVLKSFQELAATGYIEFLDETYDHSLALLYDRDEFAKQIAQHTAKIEELFGKKPTAFRNTELIYNNDLAKLIEEMGYDVILTEGANHILGWRSPNFVYQPVGCHKLRLLLRNYQLSDDIACRFSQQNWDEYPLTAEKFASWVHGINATGEVISLFMDYETFGEHHRAESGIFDFMRALPAAIFKHPDFCFRMISDAASNYQPVAKIDVPEYISWADAERDLTAWLGNDMQLDAIEALYKLTPKVVAANDPDLYKIWRRMQTSDHFYYMCTKWFSDNDVRAHVNPYGSPYDAYINFMNVLTDIELSLDKVLHAHHTAVPSARTHHVSHTHAAKVEENAAPKKTSKKTSSSTKKPGGKKTTTSSKAG